MIKTSSQFVGSMISTLGLTLIWALALPSATAQPVDAVKPVLSPAAQLEAEYRNCPGGHYTGPRPGRTRYTKDSFMWAVTPAFAAKFCFPKEFISDELKGAEAVAIKRDESKDEVICGWGNNQEVCGPSWRHWRIELYLPTGVLPSPQVRSFSKPGGGSSMMFARSMLTFQKARAAPARRGPVFPFNLNQVDGIFGIASGAVVWHTSYSSLSQEEFLEQDAGDYDYLVVSQQIGGLARPYGKTVPEQFMIVVHKPTHDGVFSQKAVAEAPVKIFLPRKLIDHMRSEDELAKAAVMRDVKRAVGAAPSNLTPTKPNN